MIKIFNVLAMVILCAESVSLFSSMKSVNGKNIDFVVNTVKKMTMTTTGVGVGTESPRSNFEVHGTWGKGFLSVASDVTLGTNSLVFVDTSAGNCTLTLPSAVDFSNQIYTVKKTVNENNLYLDGGGHLIDLDHVKKLGVSNDDLSSATVISNGQKWLTLSSAGNVDPIDATYSENLQLWLDASDLSTLTLVSGNVTSWADRSGKGHHATQSVANDHPTYYSGNMEIQFDGVSENLVVSSLDLRSNHTILMVAKTYIVPNSTQVLFCSRNSSNKYLTYNNGSFGVRNSSSGEATSAILADTKNVLVWQQDSVNGVHFYNNAVSVGSDSTTLDSFEPQLIGNRILGSSLPLNGALYEVIAYDRTLTQAEIFNLSSMLVRKWGVSN
jgi:hypothetical protein